MNDRRFVAPPEVAQTQRTTTNLWGQGSLARIANSLSSAGPTDHVPGTATATPVVALVEHFPKPETVVLGRGHGNFPVSPKDNFAARTGLKPNTEYVVEHRTRMNQVTGKAVDSIEKYFTDSTGRVVRVDAYAGIRGAWSPESKKPVPSVTYNVVAKVDGGLETPLPTPPTPPDTPGAPRNEGAECPPS